VGDSLDEISYQLHRFVDTMEDQGWNLKESETLEIKRVYPKRNGK